MPAGALVTVPEPLPDRVIVRVGVPDGGLGGDTVVDPLTPRVTVSPWAVKLTLPAKLPRLVGRKRTTTAWLAPAASVKDPPETMLNGALTLAPPVTLAPLVFWTVNVRSTRAPGRMLPKATAPVGETLTAPRATPLTAPVQALWLPELSMAVTRTTYVVPALSPVIVARTVWLALGVFVADDTG
jgi:hypothetical protein